MAYYRGKHIVKHEKVNNSIVETYVLFQDGQVYIQTYVDYELQNEICVANVTSESKLDI